MVVEVARDVRPGVRSATVQLICALIVDGHAGSLSLTVTVAVTVPGALHVTVGFAVLALLSAPGPLAAQA